MVLVACRLGSSPDVRVDGGLNIRGRAAIDTTFVLTAEHSDHGPLHNDDDPFIYRSHWLTRPPRYYARCGPPLHTHKHPTRPDDSDYRRLQLLVLVVGLDEEAAELARGKRPLEVAAKPRDEGDEAPMALFRAEVTSESRCLQEETSTVDVSWAEEYLAIVAVPDDEDASDIAK
ncbi:hypothetical protein NMY22_g2728 [Coprinellus aureogranulatus]|nr:hypothetical protein NMY22_g2728 [Coprinellus aureogranulatus]